jgi:hypothetical protein
MSQQPNQERQPLRAVQGEPTVGAPKRSVPETEIEEDASVQQVRNVVRKSTDVIVALREENQILRNELAALRRSEQKLQESVADFLGRIDQLEKAASETAAEPPSAGPVPVDRVEDSLQRSSTPGARRTTTITITIQDDQRTGLEQRVSDLVHSLVEELKRGI